MPIIRFKSPIRKRRRTLNVFKFTKKPTPLSMKEHRYLKNAIASLKGCRTTGYPDPASWINL